MVEQVTGSPLPGQISVFTRASTPLSSWLSRSSCTKNAANGRHRLHDGSPRYEANCSSGSPGNNRLYGDQSGDGVWDYVIATDFLSLTPDEQQENGLQERPRHASEAVYRTVKEIHDYRNASGANTQFLNLLITRDDDGLSNAAGDYGKTNDLFKGVQCIKESANSEGQNLDTIPLGLAYYNLYRATDTVNNDLVRLANRFYLTGEPLVFPTIDVPSYTPIFNFDSLESANTNVHFSRHGAVLSALFLSYYLYEVDPLQVTMPSLFITEASNECSGPSDLCIITDEQFTFLKHVAKYSVDQYRAGDSWASCDAHDEREIDSFILNNPLIDDFDSDFDLDNTYQDPSGNVAVSGRFFIVADET
ncbi:MAG: hypothetical protein ACI93R_003540 [Flavobacteriales bacterium]|jgi:hypothetical protein